MELNPEHSRLIDAYILGRLTEEESDTFEKLMTEEAFFEEVEFRQNVMNSAEVKGNAELRRMLEAEDQGIKQDSSLFRSRRILYWIALTLGIGICALVYYTLNQRQNPDQLFIAFYEPFPNLIAPTNRSQSIDRDGIEEAMHAYDNGAYTAASAIFDTLTNMNQNLSIYHAIANIEIENYQRAENLLLEMTRDKNWKYHDAAQWYLSLLYLKNRNDDKFDSVISQILSQAGHTYRAKAIILEQQVN